MQLLYHVFVIVYGCYFLCKQVAPIAVSDASMLAPEEVYKSAGLVKGESELTPEERKRRRAQKKRKRKGLICHLNLVFFSMCIRSQDGSSWSLTISFIIPTWKIAFTLFVDYSHAFSATVSFLCYAYEYKLK
jgi:hypothetical protein